MLGRSPLPRDCGPHLIRPGGPNQGRETFREPCRRAEGGLLVLPPPVAPRSLKPQLNQIRAWVRQGRTDAWIAHQLEVTVRDIATFKRDHGLVPAEPGNGEPDPFGPRLDEDEPDLRAEDDALVAAELEAELEDTDGDEGEDAPAAGDEQESRPRRRRGRRGGRGRRR